MNLVHCESSQYADHSSNDKYAGKASAGATGVSHIVMGREGARVISRKSCDR